MNRSVSQLATAMHAIAKGKGAFDQVTQNGAAPQAAPFVLTRRESEVLRRYGRPAHAADGDRDEHRN